MEEEIPPSIIRFRILSEGWGGGGGGGGGGGVGRKRDFGLHYQVYNHHN